MKKNNDDIKKLRGAVGKIIAGHYGITNKLLFSRSRDQLITHVRQIAIYLLQVETAIPPNKIAKIFKCNRMTVAYASMRIEELRDEHAPTKMASRRFDRHLNLLGARLITFLKEEQ